MKRILFFTHLLIGGGAEKTVVNLSEYINQNVPEVESYICVVYDDPETRKQVQNVIVLKNKTTPNMSKLQKIPVILKQAAELRALKRKLQIDTCISFLPGADFLNALSKGKERMISSVRNKESFFYQSFLKKCYIQFSYARSEKVITLSKQVEEDVVGFFGVKREKVRTIYNPLPDFTVGNQVSEEFQRLRREKQIVITAGRLTEQKGQGYLIRAFTKVIDRIPEAHLVILGQGELREELEALTKELGLSEYVSFLGFVRNPYDYISQADAFAFSSIVEGLGNVLLETLRCQTPMVSTDCQAGPREILAPRTDFTVQTRSVEIAEYGILVPVCEGDCRDATHPITKEERFLAEGILWLLADEKLHKTYQERSKVRVEDFQIDSIVKQWLEVI